MYIHGVRILLDNRVIVYFDAEQFILYLSQCVYMLYQWVCQLFDIVFFGGVVTF